MRSAMDVPTCQVEQLIHLAMDVFGMKTIRTTVALTTLISSKREQCAVRAVEAQLEISLLIVASIQMAISPMRQMTTAHGTPTIIRNTVEHTTMATSKLMKCVAPAVEALPLQLLKKPVIQLISLTVQETLVIGTILTWKVVANMIRSHSKLTICAAPARARRSKKMKPKSE